MPMADKAPFQMRVPPRLCDAQGMVHAARYHEVLEDAFLNWLDAIGHSYSDLRDAGTDLVIGTSTIRYCTPARLGDTLSVMAEPVRSTRSTVTIRFAITLAESQPVADADVTYIAVRDGAAIRLPPMLRAGDAETRCDS
jgi:acyl-CoA thioester hydrolase